MTPVEHVDLAIVLKILRALSGETDLEQLIATVLRLSLEHADADRGLLLLPSGDGYRIEAAATVGSDGTRVELRHATITSGDLPASMFSNVLRTRQSILLEEASVATASSDDEYLRRNRVRSVVFLPLLKQSQLVGVMYLEHRVRSGALTAAGMALLEVLATEAAISLANAHLYRDLREREAKVRGLVDANIIGIFTWHTDGRVFEANEEFLRIIAYSREDLTRPFALDRLHLARMARARRARHGRTEGRQNRPSPGTRVAQEGRHPRTGTGRRHALLWNSR